MKRLVLATLSGVIVALCSGCGTPIPAYEGPKLRRDQRTVLRLNCVTIEKVNGVVPRYGNDAYNRQRDDNTVIVPAGRNVFHFRYRDDKWTSERTWSEVFKREIPCVAGATYRIVGSIHHDKGVFRITTLDHRQNVADLVERPIGELKHRASGWDWSDYKE